MSNSNQLNEILKYLAQFHPIAGTIEMYAGQNAPAGWLICDGSAISRTTYSKLFEIIGQTYGTGDGSTTFNLPDMRGRTPIGVGTGTYTGATAHALGITGGAQTHTLDITQIPSHAGHLPSNSGSLSGYGTAAKKYLGQSTMLEYGSAGRGWNVNGGEITPAGINTGGGQAHNNMPPYIAITYIISTGQVEYPEIEQEENNG